ncbi:MAG: YraN family protein [Arenicellales bacterium]
MFGLPKLKNTLAVGQLGEQLALKHLKQHGLKLIEKNVRSPYGEIDLIMKENDEWVFVEVRYRQSQQFGGGLESVTPAKQRKIIKTAEHYIQLHHKTHFDACRFDIIELSGKLSHPADHADINWVKDAFQT